MKNTPKKAYTPPCFTVVRFAAEKGYASSSALLDFERLLFEYESSDPNVSQYNEDDSWAGYSWN